MPQISPDQLDPVDTSAGAGQARQISPDQLDPGPAPGDFLSPLRSAWNWLNQPPTPAERSGGFTGAVVRGIPALGGLPDVATAATTATIDPLISTLTGRAPVAPGASWSDRYRQVLAQQQSDAASWEAAHPTAARIAPILGAATMGPGRAATAAAEPVAAALPGLGRQTLSAMGVGAGLGGVGGAVRAAQDPEAGLSGPGAWQTVRDIAGGTAAGAAFGAATPAAVALATPVARAGANLARAIVGSPVGAPLRAAGIAGTPTSLLGGGADPVAQAAARAAAQQLSTDVAGTPAGAPPRNVAAIQQSLAATPGGVGPLAPPPPGYVPTPGAPSLGTAQAQPGTTPMTIADVAGRNLGPGGLAGQVATSRGTGAQTAFEFMQQRDAGAPERMAQDLDGLLVNYRAQPLSDVRQQIEATGQANATRDYNTAILDPSGQPRQVMSPELQNVINGSDDLRQVMDAYRRSIPGVPDDAPFSDMRLLDRAYQFLNGRLAGSGPNAHLYAEIKGPFSKALTDANPDYQTAIDNYRGFQTSLRAIDDGAGVFNRNLRGPEISAAMSGYSPADQNLFRYAAADQLAKQLNSGTPGANEALRLIGTPERREQIRALFPAGPAGDANYQQLMARGWAENEMKQSQGTVFGGSQTYPRQAMMAPPAEGGGGLGKLIAGGALALHGEPAAAFPMGEAASQLARGSQQVTPEVAGELSRNLWSADPNVQREFLQRMLTLPPPPQQMLRYPIGAAGYQLTPYAGAAIGYGRPLVDWLRQPFQEEQRPNVNASFR